MARPPTSRIMPGSPYPARAETWNDLIDTHQTIESIKEQTVVQDLLVREQHNAVLVQMDDQARGEGEYVVITGVVTDPGTGGEGVFRMYPSLVSTQEQFGPGAWGRIAILAEDAGPNTIAKAYVTGTCIARLVRTYSYHDHADMHPEGSHPDGTTPLVSHPSGSWQILWDNATPEPNFSQAEAGWAIVRHRGIWDRTMAGIAAEDIPLDGEGLVDIYSGLHSTDPNTPTGEQVTAVYTYSSGEAIKKDNEVTLEWQSDFCLWTVYKFGGPAGSGPSTADAATFTVTGINRINQHDGAVYLTQVPPGDLENNNIELLPDNWNIDLLSTGESSVSYAVTLTIPSLTGSGVGGTSIEKQWVRFSVQGARTSGGEQRTDILFTPAAPGLVEPNDPIAYLPSVVSVSGTALAPSGAALYLSIDIEDTGPLKDLDTQGLTISGQLIVVQDVIT